MISVNVPTLIFLEDGTPIHTHDATAEQLEEAIRVLSKKARRDDELRDLRILWRARQRGMDVNQKPL